jgi:hypothetical protein
MKKTPSGHVPEFFVGNPRVKVILIDVSAGYKCDAAITWEHTGGSNVNLLDRNYSRKTTH